MTTYATQNNAVMMYGLDTFHATPIWSPLEIVQGGIAVYIAGSYATINDNADSRPPLNLAVPAAVAELWAYNSSGNAFSRVRIDSSFNLKTAGPTSSNISQINVTSAGLALSANANRKYLLIQNVSTANVLLVGLGIDVSSGGNAAKALILGSAASGAGGSYESPASFVFTGNVYLSGTSPNAVVIEGT